MLDKPVGWMHNHDMNTNTPLTPEQRVDLYVKIITEKMKGTLTDFNVAYMRNQSPGQKELDALNGALVKLGWQK